MKKIVLLFSFIIVSTMTMAQEATKSSLPIYPGCEEFTNQNKQYKCLGQNLGKFVMKKFNANDMKKVGVPQGQHKIYMSFNINEEGKITNIETKTDYPALAKEAKRVLQLAPAMKPAIMSGEPKAMPYRLPIVVSVL